jgi:single-strand DNA-binding protein
MHQQVTVVGNLGQDATMEYTPSGVPYTRLSVAVNESWTGADGVKHDKTTWWRATCWRKLAEIAGQYCTKGKLVLITANKIESKHYVDKNGEVRNTLECTVETLRLLGSKQDGPGTPVDSGNEVREEDIPF